MDTLRSIIQVQREALFTQLATAFANRDFRTIERAMREDVVLDLPGTSPFAGEHHGREAVGKFILGIRQFILSTEQSFTFSHDANAMTAVDEITVAGPNHIVEMMLRVSLDFDREERIYGVRVEPSDPGLFTHVIAAAFSMA